MQGMKEPRSLVQLKCWLKSVNVPYAQTAPTTLLVTKADGTQVPVQIVLKGAAEPPVGPLRIHAEWITGRKIQGSLAIFEAFQEVLGYKPKKAVDRGTAPDRKLANGEDFDLTAFRHTEFRRVPNPDPVKFKLYQPIMERIARKFMRDNFMLCQDNMLSVEDLLTYAQVWTTIFCGRDELPGGEAMVNDNARLLTTHLSQKFHWFKRNVIGRARNVLPALDNAHIAQHGRPYEHGNKGTWETQTEFDDDDDDLIKRRRREWQRGQRYEVDVCIGDPVKRRTSASKLLERLLGGLDHDQLVDRLKSVSESNRVSPDAAGEARKRLEVHVEGCTGCASLAAKVDEDVAGADPGGPLEQVADLP